MRVSVAFVTLALSLGASASPLASPHAMPEVSLASLGGGSEVLSSLSSFQVTRVSMAEVRQRKEKVRQSAREVGAFAANSYSSVAAANVCTNGKAASTYSCKNIDLHGFLSHQALGSSTREGNDVWGWTAPNGREFGVVGQTDGTAFVEILADGSLKYWGRLKTQTVNAIWRDMKVIDGYAYIGAESRNHGIQIFDLRKLLTLTAPKVFSTSTDLTNLHTGITNSHNIVANEATKMIYAVGTNKCSGGLYMLDVSNPSSPVYKGCASSDGYVHDAQCVIYTGPTTAYKGKEVCFGFNEDTLTIYDVSNKASVKVISRTTYSGAAYTHQGWIADAGMNYLLADDELDEQENTAVKGNAKTSTYIWDIKNLAAPKLTGIYLSQAKSIDHNLYVVNGKAYMSNYSSGLRIVDVSSVTSDPTGAGFREIGHFDVYPEDDSKQVNDFFGAWSVYPYFKSGYILINSIERGIFSVKYTGA